MDKEKLNETIGIIANSFTAKTEEEANKRVKESVKYLENSEFTIKNAEQFNYMVSYKVENCMKQVARYLYKGKSNKADFLYVHYSFMEHNIRELCSLREGSSCCADKSRYILKMFLEYSLNGVVPEFNPEIEEYWIPNFGDNEMWINFCESLIRLYYGNTEEYLESYQALVTDKIRLFPHIIHWWHIKYQNGTDIKFANTWDKNLDVPLSKENINGRECYLVMDNKIGENTFPKYICDNSKNEFLFSHVVCVPVDEVEIYHVDEEEMC